VFIPGGLCRGDPGLAGCARPAVEREGTQVTFQGAIFDVDGVLVDSPHEPAWRDSLRELMEGDWADIAGQTTWTADGFTSQVY
jgi:hypothetical protein